MSEDQRKKRIYLSLKPATINAGRLLARKYKFRSLSSLIDHLLIYIQWLDLKRDIKRVSPEFLRELYEEAFRSIQRELGKGESEEIIREVERGIHERSGR